MNSTASTRTTPKASWLAPGRLPSSQAGAVRQRHDQEGADHRAEHQVDAAEDGGDLRLDGEGEGEGDVGVEEAAEQRVQPTRTAGDGGG